MSVCHKWNNRKNHNWESFPNKHTKVLFSSYFLYKYFIEKLKIFSYLRDFFNNDKHSCRKPVSKQFLNITLYKVLHLYIKVWAFIFAKKKKLKNKNIKKKKKPNERKSEGIFAATRQFTNIFLFLFLFREKFWRKGMFSSIQELRFLMSIKYLLRVTLT